MPKKKSEACCRTCVFWSAWPEAATGDCLAASDCQDEAILHVDIAEQLAKGGPYVPVTSERRDQLCASLVTPAYFYCASWQEDENA